MDTLQREGRGRNAELRAVQTTLEDLVAECAKKLPSAMRCVPMGSARGHWSSVPHTCDMCCLTVTATDALERMSLSEAPPRPQTLADAWRSRHESTLAAEVDAATRRKNLRCWEHDRCLCKGQGRLLSLAWGRATRAIKEWMLAPDSRKAVADGYIAIQWRGEALHAEDPGCGVDEGREIWTHIAVQRFRPWYAVFLLMRLCDRPLDSCNSGSLELGNADGASEGPPVAEHILEVIIDNEQMIYMYWPSLVTKWNLDWKWTLTFHKLSQKRRPFPDSHGRVRVLEASAPSLFWKGLQEETKRARLQSRCQRSAAANRPAAPESEPQHEQAPGDEGPKSSSHADGEEDWLEDDGAVSEDEEAMFAAELEELWEEQEGLQEASHAAHAAENANSASGSSSDSSSSDDNNEAEDNVQPAPSQAEPAAGGHQSGSRARQEFTHSWGRGFLFTFKRPHLWQARCAYHARHEVTKCTKSLTLKDASAPSREEGLRLLKIWCVDACNHETRLSHMGGRGLPRLSAAQAALTSQMLDELEARLPDPPE